MKIRIAIAFVLVLSLLGGSSCKKLRDLATFTINNTSYTTIPSGGIVNLPFQLFTPDVQTNSAQEFSTNKTEAKLVRTAFLKALTLSIYEPEQANFDFLRSVEVFISADNLEEKRIAVKTDIPQTGLKSILVNTDSSVDLKEYIKGDSYNLRIQVVTRQLPGSDITLRIQSAFEVEANVF